MGLDDIVFNKYQDEFQVEMLLQNVEGFGDGKIFISSIDSVVRIRTGEKDAEAL